MNSLSIKELLTFTPGSVIPCTGGRIASISDQITGEENGGWTAQDIVLEDATGKIPARIGNHPAFTPEHVGQIIYVIAGKKQKGGLIGVKVEEEEVPGTGKYRYLAISRSAQFLSEEEYAKQAEVSAPPATFPPFATPVQQQPETAGQTEAPVTNPAPAKKTGMRVKELHFEKVVNTGNYCSERLGVVIELEPGTKAQDAIEAAKAFVTKNLPNEAAPPKGRVVG